jgi:hypothetical protein
MSSVRSSLTQPPSIAPSRSPVCSNFEFPPNTLKNTAEPGSPWPAVHRSDHVLSVLVLAFPCVPITHRPNQLCWTDVDRREHLELSPDCAVTVVRAFRYAVSEIKLGETLIKVWIRSQSSESDSHCVLQPVLARRCSGPCHASSRTWRCEELEARGLFCKCQRLV